MAVSLLLKSNNTLRDKNIYYGFVFMYLLTRMNKYSVLLESGFCSEMSPLSVYLGAFLFCQPGAGGVC